MEVVMYIAIAIVMVVIIVAVCFGAFVEAVKIFIKLWPLWIACALVGIFQLVGKFVS